MVHLLSATIETVFIQMKPVTVSGQYKVPLNIMEIIVGEIKSFKVMKKPSLESLYFQTLGWIYKCCLILK